jgi:hypothetical protein
MFWLSSYITSHHIAVGSQSGSKDQFNCTVYCLTLNSNSEAEREPKNGKIGLESKINTLVISIVFFTF